MSKELFEKLKDTKSPSGWTIARAINTGVSFPTSFVGCHAGDKESYDIFGELFKPVIESKILKNLICINNINDKKIYIILIK